MGFIGATVVAPGAYAGGPYDNCKQAHADGRYNIPKGDPDYRSKLDRDGDGIACEG
ncbi:excalibur calcium-binding domain-containing protein [Candidatus Mycobacterium wuenschmannii]|uniref:Excalibur calcium-binding domain-containing protein n=1 Tax=Candidatus Mycobacterium wuenschmannii TaxID=3027808 RepID=A0ABY8W434_9MYCO|nr:excalibur calcium-binding domain-containing protein [Candidatus Mycobacterium wuenschmannii]WIM89787.1 excalibur calcium-binding domain-containing protein [Candidatus Mycobacterium wuenschmannii]